MNEPPADFDLKFMPDWLKEQSAKNPYADYEVRERPDRDRDRGDRFGRGPGGRDRGPRPPRGEQNRGPRRDQQGRGDGRGPQQRGGNRPERGQQRGGPAARGNQPPRGGHGVQHQQPPRGAEAQPAAVKIEFLPDPNAATSIARQIKATNRAYSLFDLARMFLAKPERHRVRITSIDPAKAPLFQAGENGPVGFDRQAVERAAFSALKSRFYSEEIIQRDPPKGNFTNVARHRPSGVLLGPTNYHGYQPALRKLYEERYSRRMSFQDFLRDVETVSDPALVEQWKDQIRTTTVYKLISPKAAEAPNEETAQPELTSQAAAEPAAVSEPQIEPAPASEAASETPPAPAEGAAAEQTPPPSASQEQPDQSAQPQSPNEPVFESFAEVEQHFRKNHLEALMRSGNVFEISGEASRMLPDRRIAAEVRQAWEKERGFPGQMMHHLRAAFSRSNLHVFKHHKRMQFVSAIRPTPFAGNDRSGLSSNIADVLRIIETTPNCTRATLASALLGETKEDDPALTQRKAALATDLRWLIDAGRVIEFFDGKLELPQTAAAKPASGQTTAEPVTPVKPDPGAPQPSIVGEPPAPAEPGQEEQPTIAPANAPSDVPLPPAETAHSVEGSFISAEPGREESSNPPAAPEALPAVPPETTISPEQSSAES